MSAQRWAPAATWATSVLAAVGTWILLIAGTGDATPGDTFVIGGWGGFVVTLAGLAFSTVGALVAARLPQNRVGRLFCLIGLLLNLGDLAYHYADQGLYGSAQWLPAAELAAWSQNLLVPPAFGVIGAALILFPDGLAASPRWRRALLVPLAGSVLVASGYALRGGPLDEPFETVLNPFGIDGSEVALDGVAMAGWLLTGLGFAVAAAAVRTRRRRARGLERQQLNWIALAAAFAGAIMILVFATFFLDANSNSLRIVGFGLALPAVPVAAGIAILRYRLYDIDVVVNRALVYGALSALLAGTYLGSVLVLQLLLEGVTEGSGLAVAASTLATAALVRPARARIQRAVDLRFFRSRYDASTTIQSFGARLRDQVDLDELESELGAVVARTMQPASVSLWLRGPA